MTLRGVVAGDRTTVVDAIQRHLEGRPEILCAYLHGSFPTGGPYRDIDVALLLDRPHGDDWAQYVVDLAAELAVAVSQTVDVRMLNDASLAFRYHVLKDVPLLVRDWERLDEFRARTWDEYFDFLPFARQYLRDAFGETPSVREANLDRLRELAGYLRNTVRQLSEVTASSEDAFLRDPRSVNSAKYLLIVAAEAALDICNHLVARRGGRSPRDYADCIAILGEIGVIDEDLRNRLVRMARFRNLLVHLYDRLDDRKVYQVIVRDLGDFDRYLTSIGQYLRTELC